ncbi:MAG: phosphate ABC transporter substrate-binding protein PstS [Clostridia bacterium]|nr:phosphate ABC transporter substrate-binding protein PstS [Clostridia bacterium]
MRKRFALWITGVLLGALLAGCGAASSSPTGGGGGTSEAGGSNVAVALTGAGSTFDFPLFDNMFKKYHELHPNVTVNYQSIGSGGGQKALFDATVRFAASDAFLSDDQMKQHPDLVHIPITIGAVSVGYNLPGVDHLRLTGKVLADLCLGRITKWNDKAIQDLNPGVPLPDLPVAVVHRSDGSGTTFIFTNYLSAVSPEWAGQVGAGTAVNWPTGIGGKGSEGVAGQVRQTPGAIGYFEMAYAMENGIQQATMQNKDGNWVDPSSEGASAAAAGAAANMPQDLRVLFVDAPGPNSYPISGFSWIIVRKNLPDTPENRALVQLLDWMIHDGQQVAEPLHYAPLPDPVVKLDEQVIRSIGAGGKSLLGK